MGSYQSPSSDHDQLLNPTSTKSSQPAASNLPLRKVPGGYGLPFFGPLKDRWDYFYNQGRDEFFKSRMRKYNSTVFRTNMPPGPLMNFKPQVVVLVDAVSFPTVFDFSKVDKTNALGGTYLPPAKFTGGYRTCAYLDPSDPKHTKLKSLIFSLIGSRHQNFIPETEKCVAELFETIESQVCSSKGEANFNDLSGEMLFNLLFRLFFNVNPSETIMGPEGSKLVTKWQLFMLHPTITFGLPKFLNVIEDLLLHTYYLPFFPIKSGYEKFYSVIRDASTSILDQAEEKGIGRDEASHNLVFAFFLNGYGGLKTFFPTLMKYVALGGEKLHQQLRNEIRTVVKTSQEGLTFDALEKMPLTKSVVYEAFRMEPPVPRQYGRAKKDFVIESHDASFEVKKGELILGFQPLAMRDGKVFVNPNEFVANRFVGVEGEKMLNYLYWSNNRETNSPTEVNKQCPGRDLTLLITRLFVAELFLRYDTVSCDVVDLPTGASVKFKSFTKTGASVKFKSFTKSTNKGQI